MSVYLRIVGFLAKLIERGHRVRLLLIPLHWLLIIFPLSILVFLLTVELNRSFQASVGVPTLSVSETFSSFATTYYVNVQGKLLSKAQIIEGSNGKPTRAWAPLLDPKTQQVIYVELPAPKAEEEEASDASFVGILVEPPKELQTEIVSSLKNYLSFTEEDISELTNTHYILIPRAPPELSTTRIVATVFLQFLLIFIFIQTLSLVRRGYVVLQPEKSFPALEKSDKDPTQIEMFATGLFRLNDLDKLHLVNVRSIWATLETGQHAIVTQTRTPYQDPQSFWGIILRKGSIGAVLPAKLFFGLSVYPSIQVGYIDDVDGQPRGCILSFRSESERQIALQKVLALQAA